MICALSYRTSRSRRPSSIGSCSIPPLKHRGHNLDAHYDSYAAAKHGNYAASAFFVTNWTNRATQTAAILQREHDRSIGPCHHRTNLVEVNVVDTSKVLALLIIMRSIVLHCSLTSYPSSNLLQTCHRVAVGAPHETLQANTRSPRMLLRH